MKLELSVDEIEQILAWTETAKTGGPEVILSNLERQLIKKLRRKIGENEPDWVKLAV